MMKEFFYLDTGLLQSYISQIFKGLLTNIIEERLNKASESEGNEKTSTEIYLTGKLGVDGKIKPKILFEGGLSSALEGGVNYTISDGEKKEEVSNEFKSIFQKALKDDLFDEFENYLKNEKLICDKASDFMKDFTNNPQLYFKIKSNFNYINLDRIDTMFQGEYSDVYRDQCDDSRYPTTDYFLSVKKSIKLLRTMLPYDTFLCSDEYIVLLNEKHLRVDKNIAGFKFNPNATVIGRIRKTTLESPSANQQPKVIEVLNKIQTSTFNILYKQGFVSEIPQYIIDPIAIYYE